MIIDSEQLQMYGFVEDVVFNPKVSFILSVSYRTTDT